MMTSFGPVQVPYKQMHLNVGQKYEEERFHGRDTIFLRSTPFEQSPSRMAMDDEMWRPPAFPNLLWAEEVRKFCQHWGSRAQQPKVVQRLVDVWSVQVG